MICNKCHNELTEHQLICPYCGNDICIVPVFDIEMQQHFDQAREDMADLISISLEGVEDEDDIIWHIYWGQHCKRFFKKHWKIFLLIFLAIISVVGIVFAEVSFYRSHSYTYQLDQGMKAREEENFDDAVYYLKKAIAIQDEDIAVRYMLATCLYQIDQVEESIAMLLELTNLGEGDTETYVETLFLCYINEERYQEASDLLDLYPYEELLSTYQNYLALSPEFSFPSGTYKDVLPLKITANTGGTVYYTLDGSTPTTSSTMYTSPIFLEAGYYVIQAIFVNRYGMVSDIASSEYWIEISAPLAPEVLLFSNSYDSPQWIIATAEEDCNIYYTLDGTDPTVDSILYTQSIPLPLGDSLFRFVAVNQDGVMGPVTEREYTFTFLSTITVEVALQTLMYRLVEKEVILDIHGYSLDRLGQFSYYGSTVILEGEKYYYLFIEQYADLNGLLHATGNAYAVDTQSGEIFLASRDNQSGYSFSEF